MTTRKWTPTPNRFIARGEWVCPNCGEHHVDLVDRGTYCHRCKLLVWVGRADKGVVDIFTDWLFLEETE